MDEISEIDNEKITAEENSSRVFHNSLLISYFILLFILLVVITLAAVSSSRFSHFTRMKEHSQVRTLINEEMDTLSALALEYGWWTEAIDHMIYNHNDLWVDVNFGPYLFEEYELSWILPYDMEGNLHYGVLDSNPVEISPLAVFDKSINQLIERALDCDLTDPTPVSGILKIENELHFVAVNAFAAYEPTELDTAIPHGYLILSRRIDTELLNHLSSKSGIYDMALAAGETESIKAKGRKIQKEIIYNPEWTEIGAIYWPENKAIKQFFSRIIYLAVLSVLFIFLLSLWFFRNLHKYHRLTKDIIETQKASNIELSYKANYDELTGLTNRNLFLDRLEQSLKRSKRNNTKSAMLFLDLDGFKSINDTLGHIAGDEILIQVGNRLKGLIRAQDTVSRIGGDEYCIILEDIASVTNTDIVLSKIIKLFEHPFLILGTPQYLGISIGVVLIPDDGRDTVSLMRFADIAMMHAKKESSSRYIYFNKEFDKKTHRRSIIKTGLRNAIDRNEVFLQYQPIYDLKDRSLNYVEALVRWKSPELGFVSPEEFITIAEETGLIIDLGYWIIEQSLKDIQAINSKTDREIRVSINISVNQLREADFLDTLLTLMKKYRIESSLVQLEITENTFIDDSILQSGIFMKLHDLGYKLVMDDFGTGYSSLSYIQMIPLQTIKIDKSFITDFRNSNEDGALIKSIVYMADAFKLDTVAEGIETQEQDDFLLSTGCRYGQGYLYSPPTGKDEIITIANAMSIK